MIFGMLFLVEKVVGFCHPGMDPRQRFSDIKSLAFYPGIDPDCRGSFQVPTNLRPTVLHCALQLARGEDHDMGLLSQTDLFSFFNWNNIQILVATTHFLAKTRYFSEKTSKNVSLLCHSCCTFFTL